MSLPSLQPQASLGASDPQEKKVSFLLASATAEPSDWSTFFQQAILSLSLNVRLGFSRFIALFKANIQVDTKISNLREIYKEKEKDVSGNGTERISFDELTSDNVLPSEIQCALKEIEIFLLALTPEQADEKFKEIQQRIESISVSSSPRESKRQDVKPHQQGNEKPIGSIADLVSKVVQILSQFTSETPSFKHQA